MSRSKPFSTDGKTIYYFGVAQTFEPRSFTELETRGCPLWTDRYVSDMNDVYIPLPQSCGDSCDSGEYLGFYWAPLNVRDPSSFVMLGGGYGRDAERVYYQWGGTLEGHADPATFEVMWCGDDDSGELIARDASNYFIDGEVADAAQIEEKWPLEPCERSQPAR